MPRKASLVEMSPVKDLFSLNVSLREVGRSICGWAKNVYYLCAHLESNVIYGLFGFFALSRGNYSAH